MAKFIPIETAEARVTEIDAQMLELSAERRVLQRFLGSAVSMPESTPARARVTSRGPPRSFTTTSLVMDFIRSNPGQPGKVIVEGVAPMMQSASSDPKRMIYSLLSTLTRRKKLRKEGSGYVVA